MKSIMPSCSSGNSRKATRNASFAEVATAGAASQSAFTLIELLVSIGIIALLASLLFPQFSRMHQSALATKCAANLRQIGAAAAMWSGDNDGYIMPYTRVGEEDYRGQNNWTGMLGTYLGRTTTGDFTSASELPVAICPLHSKRFGYGVSVYMSPWSTHEDGSNYVKTTKLSAVPAPSKIVFMTDNATPDLTNEWKDGVWRCFTLPPSFGTDLGIYTYFGHPGNTANFLWLDGHVSTEKKDSPAMDPNDSAWAVN